MSTSREKLCIYRCLISYIVNAIHVEWKYFRIFCIVTWNLMFFFWFGTNHFLYKALDVFVQLRRVVFSVVRKLISVLDSSALYEC